MNIGITMYLIFIHIMVFFCYSNHGGIYIILMMRIDIFIIIVMELFINLYNGLL